MEHPYIGPDSLTEHEKNDGWAVGDMHQYTVFAERQNFDRGQSRAWAVHAKPELRPNAVGVSP